MVESFLSVLSSLSFVSSLDSSRPEDRDLDLERLRESPPSPFESSTVLSAGDLDLERDLDLDLDRDLPFLSSRSSSFPLEPERDLDLDLDLSLFLRERLLLLDLERDLDLGERDLDRDRDLGERDLERDRSRNTFSLRPCTSMSSKRSIARSTSRLLANSTILGQLKKQLQNLK